MDITPKYEHLPKVIIKKAPKVDSADKTPIKIIEIGQSSRKLLHMRIAVASSITALGIAAGAILLSTTTEEETNSKEPIARTQTLKTATPFQEPTPTETTATLETKKDVPHKELPKENPPAPQQKSFKKNTENQPYRDSSYDKAIGKPTPKQRPGIIRDAPF